MNGNPNLSGLDFASLGLLGVEDIVRLAKSDAIGRVKTFSINLTSAGSKNFDFTGNFLKVIEATDNTASIRVRFNRPDEDFRTFRLNTREKRIFTQILIEWDAQPAKTLKFVCAMTGEKLLYDHESFDPVQNISSLADITGSIYGLTKVPPGATLVNARAALNNEDNATLYTVPAGKTLHILQSGIVLHNAASAPAHAWLMTHDGSSFHQFINFSGGGVAAGSSFTPHSFLTHIPKIEVPENQTIQVQGYESADFSTPGDVYSLAYIRGYYI